MLDILIFFIFILLFVFLLINHVKLFIQNINYKKQIILLIKNKDNDINQDHFLKFITESREAAFGYIDEIQKRIIELDNTIKLQILENDINNKDNCCKEYSKLSSLLFKELDSLKIFLPEEDKNGR